MTISSPVRTAGPFTGDGVAGSFPFTFKVFSASDLIVVQTVSGVDSTLVLGTDYGVNLNADQNAAPGGALISKVAGVDTPLTTGYIWNATSAVANLQPVKLTNNGGFFPTVINDALDRLTILVQQLVRAVNASLQYPLSDGTGISNILPNKASRLGKVLAFDPSTGAPVVSTQTLAQIEAGSTSAAASAAAAHADRLLADADVVLTHADVTTTNANVIAAAAQVTLATAQVALATGYANISLNAAGFGYTFSTNTASSDPGAGFIKFNNATLASATACYISETSALAQGIAAIIATWDDSTSTVRSLLKIVKGSDPTVFAIFSITGTITDNGTWDTITVAYIGGAGVFANNDTVFIQNARTGDAGANGSVPFAVAAGTVDAITANFTPDISLSDGQTCEVRSGGANTITNPTFAPDGLTARTIVKHGGVALVAGDTGAAGSPMLLQYDLGNTRWELLNPAKITEADMVLVDNTTNNSTTAKHGLQAKGVNTAGLYYDSQMGQTNPALTSVLTGYTSGAGTVAATDTVIQAIQKLNGNAGGAAGLTVIASGNCATGSPTVIDITSIPATYRSLVLYVNGASNSVAGRALLVSVDTGLGLGNAGNLTAAVQINNTTTTAVNNNALWNVVTQTAAQVSSCIVNFPAYQSGPIKSFHGNAFLVQGVGGEWPSGGGANSVWFNGVLSSNLNVSRTGAIVGIRITWDNVATGVFDGGTYALYGVN